MATEAMDHAPARKAVGEIEAPRGRNLTCAECIAPYTSSQPGQLFCCPDHRIAFQDRMRVRGRQLVPLELAVMATRQGRTGDRDAGVQAARAANRLKRAWIAEDKAANDGRGRLPMDQYIRRLIKHRDLPI